MDRKHTDNLSTLEKLITRLDDTFSMLTKSNDKIEEQLIKLNDNFSAQDKRILKMEYDIEDLAEDSEEFKGFLASEKEKAEARGKETRDWILKIVGILVGGGGISWLIAPFFGLFK